MVSAMLGMVGASGTFGAVFFVTPELFPTNMIPQASGLSSFMGRLGGMLAPFMTDLEKEISNHTVGLQHPERVHPPSGSASARWHCNGPGVVQRRDRQKKEFHDQSDYR